ncbi:MAG: transporter substrate-binding domain-containing protein, partial [Planctomycetes bacterium]|nr:transporter substrate-binding domain-containing protein [Planctomycetota bacterium]
WMFASIVIISGYTASIASALTVDQLQSVVRGPEDLGKVRVGTLRGSAATTWLDEQGVRYTGFANVADAMQALERGDLEAVVYDAPILKSLALGSDQLVVLPNQLRVEQYAIAMPRGSDLRKPLNRALIKVLQSEEWREARRRYLGE